MHVSTADSAPPDGGDVAVLFLHMPVLPTIRQANDALIAEALRHAKNNHARASDLLSIVPSSFNERLKRAEGRNVDEAEI